MLWDVSLLSKLPKNLLASVHREVCCIRSSGWGGPTSKRARIYERGWNALCDYHLQVMCEMKRRGWNFNRSWADYSFRGIHNPIIDRTFLNDYTTKEPMYTADEINAQEQKLSEWEVSHGWKSAQEILDARQ